MTLKDQFKRMKENWLIVLLILIVLVMTIFPNGELNVLTAKLGGEMGYAESAVARDMVGVPSPYYYDDGDFAPEIEERILTKTASLTSEIKRGDFQEAEDKLKAIVSSSDSFILNENVYKSGIESLSTYHGNYQIKVESSKYAAVVSQLKELGKVTSFNENVQDETGRYSSLEEQLSAEKERLALFQEMYDESTDVSEKIELSDRIFNQERLIEYLEDAIKNIDTRVSYSSIYVNLNEKESGYVGVALVKFSELIRNLVNSINGLLNLIVMALPYALVAFLVWLGYKKFAKKK